MKKSIIICLMILNFIITNKIMAKTIIIHYHRFENDYDKWNIWFWPKNGQGQPVYPDQKDEYGPFFMINVDTASEEYGLILRKGSWEEKDGGKDRFINITRQTEFWLLQDEDKIFTSPPDLRPKIINAYIDKKNIINVFLSQRTDPRILNKKNILILDRENRPVKIKKIFFGYFIQPVSFFEISLANDLEITNELSKYTINLSGYQPQNLAVRNLLSDPSLYSDTELGYQYSPGQTRFRIFSPAALSITLQLYNSITDTGPEIIPLSRKSKGIWEVMIKKDILNKLYTYKISGSIEGFSPDREIVDIYSRCNTGKYNKGLIINDQTPLQESPQFPVEDTIIYELHIRDFTIDPDSHIMQRGKYLGLTEQGTEYEGLKTGIDHLTELGVNAVQLMPVQDFENDEDDPAAYNWGYMPLSFNSPDGWYASNTADDSRVKELKSLINALHKNRIKVFMDVVYNHTSLNASFEKIMPGYYFRRKPDGTLWNGSGCGNEFQTEYPMARKYILDSLKYWIKEYKIDGFRFDLMGLIDIDTMILITKELKKINRDIMVYGEPWTGGASPAKQTIKGTQKGKGFAVFNDNFRDAIKGSTFIFSYGYIQGNTDPDIIEKIKNGVTGSISDFTESPLETINYAACHDNHTLWDRINLTLKDNHDPEQDNITVKKNMQKLAGALLLVSQGIPFLHSGQEFCRTKKGENNSYNKDDSINSIAWIWKKEYSDIFQYYQGLIRLRKEHPAFRLISKKEILQSVKFFDAPEGCIAFRINNKKDTWKNIFILINPLRKEILFNLPEGKWNLAVNRDKAGTEIIQSDLEGTIQLPSTSLFVLYQ